MDGMFFPRDDRHLEASTEPPLRIGRLLAVTALVAVAVIAATLLLQMTGVEMTAPSEFPTFVEGA